MKDFPFIQTYIDYHRESTDAPIKYAKLLGAQLLGHAMGRDSIHLIQPKPVHHNLFLTLIGDSTLTRKDTSQDLAKGVYPTELSLPQEFTPEQFEKELEEQPESIGWLGEFTHFLKQIDRKYMTGIVEIINRLYVNPPEYRRAIRGDSGDEEGEQTIIKNPYIVINSTVTPKMLKKNISPELMLGGFLARWLLVKGEPHRRDRGRLKKKRYQTKKVVKDMINATLEMDGGTFEFTDKALENFNKVEKKLMENKMALPFAGRYSQYIIKLSDIFAVSDALGSVYNFKTGEVDASSLNQLMEKAGFDRTRPSSEVRDVDEAIQIPSKYLKKSYKVVADCLNYAVELTEYTEQTKVVAELWSYVKENAPVGHSEAMRDTGLNADQMRDAKSTLIQMDKMHLSKVPVENPGAVPNKTKDVLCTEEKFKSEECEECEYRAGCFEEDKDDAEN